MHLPYLSKEGRSILFMVQRKNCILIECRKISLRVWFAWGRVPSQGWACSSVVQLALVQHDIVMKRRGGGLNKWAQ